MNWIKIWDWQTPPPQLGQNPNFFQKFDLKASLREVVKKIDIF